MICQNRIEYSNEGRRGQALQMIALLSQRWYMSLIIIQHQFFIIFSRFSQFKGNIKFQAISVGCYQILPNIKIWQLFITQIIPMQSSKESNTPTQLDHVPQTGQTLEKIQIQSQQITTFKSNEKQKKIIKKPESILRKLRIENPLSFTHVHNIFNMMGINQSAIQDSNYQQSYFKTMFYINTVERVELRKYALIIQLKSAEKSLQPISYLIERYKSFGDKKFYDIATSIQEMASKVTGQSFMQKLKKSFDGEPLSRFIDSMEDQTYMCKVAPNKLVISRKLLELIGEDPENYAVEICKYKMPLREIISAQSYSTIIKKTIDNITSVCNFINATITAEELHEKSSIDFTDYLINRQNKKIYCNLILFMPTPQMSCIQVREVLSESEEVRMRCSNFARKKQMIEKRCEEVRYSEAEILKNITRVPEGLLKSNIRKLADYRDISTQA